MSATKMKAVVQTSGSHHHHLNSKYYGFHVADLANSPKTTTAMCVLMQGMP